MSFSYTAPSPPPGPKGKYEWGGPRPDGYEWPPGSMQPGAFLVCDECGGAVAPNATEKHDDWHQRIG